MTKIYEQFDNAFSYTSATAILNSKGDYIGKVCLKYPRDGAGRLTAYFHLFSLEMSKGIASGYGYDKGSAAVAQAVLNAKPLAVDKYTSEPYRIVLNDTLQALQNVFKNIDGRDWRDVLRDSGFTVLAVL